MDGEKSFTGISCSVKDQFYSEIYNFLVESYSDVIKDLMNEKKQKLGQVQVPSEKAQKENVARILD
jgi:predicted CopG family antitoxin